MAKIKRSEVKTFIDTTPATTATWSLLGDGVASNSVNMNPEVVTETYVHQDNGTTSVERYAPTSPVESTAIAGDPVFEFVDGLRKARATLSAAETEIVNVWLYETPTSGAYPAEKQAVSIQVDTWGGDGGVSNKIAYTINYNGDPVLGTFNPTTLTFTAS